jgi:hypothetical protein
MKPWILKKKLKEKFSRNLENMINDKKKAYKKWLPDRKMESKEEYVEMRRVKVRVRKGKNEYWDRLQRY